MPIPAFSSDGVLPPFLGQNGPAGSPSDMSPYNTDALEIVTRFSTTIDRKSILRGWLDHRLALRTAGFHHGFQWLDGSFVEDKQPQDLDVVTFVYRPDSIPDKDALSRYIQSNRDLLDRAKVREKFKLDFMLVDLNGSPEVIVESSRYFMNLFSHRRNDYLWKGMLRVSLNDQASDQAALTELEKVSTL